MSCGKFFRETPIIQLLSITELFVVILSKFRHNIKILRKPCQKKYVPNYMKWVRVYLKGVKLMSANCRVTITYWRTFIGDSNTVVLLKNSCNVQYFKTVTVVLTLV